MTPRTDLSRSGWRWQTTPCSGVAQNGTLVNTCTSRATSAVTGSAFKVRRQESGVPIERSSP